MIPLTKKELAQAYKVSPGTLRNWLKKIGFTGTSKILMPTELSQIYDKYGNPN